MEEEKSKERITEEVFQPGDTLLSEGDWGRHVLRRGFHTPIGRIETHRMQAEYIITKEDGKIVERKVPDKEKDLGIATPQEIAALRNKRPAGQGFKKAA